MNTKTPPNTAALKSLKNQGFSVKINHFRRKKWKDKFEPLLSDKKIREAMSFYKGEPMLATYSFGYHLFSERGGATVLELKRGEEQIKVRADCYVKDSFSKREGVKQCLERLEKLHGIKTND